MFQGKTGLWKDLVDYINSQDVGSTISRVEILRNVNPNRNFSEHYMDKLGRMLRVLGYLKTEGLGLYKVVKTIPINLTSSELERLAYPNPKSCV